MKNESEKNDRGKPEAKLAPEVKDSILRLHVRGFRPEVIQREVLRRFDLAISRQAPYRVVTEAGGAGLLKYEPSYDNPLSRQVSECYRWLKGVDVVHSSRFIAVACRTAERILELVCELAAKAGRNNEVHVGFAGGFSMKAVAQELAELLKGPVPDLPERIVFHTVISGFDVDTIHTDPNAFLIYFTHPEIEAKVKTAFVPLHAPPLVKPEWMGGLRQSPTVNEAFAKRDLIDIIVTSAGLMEDPHSMIYNYYGEEMSHGNGNEVFRQLEADGCVGDLCWMPIGHKGPIDTSGYPYQGMTLFELAEFPGLLEQGKQIILSIGPCTKCGVTRSEVLRAILNQKKPLISHLHLDSATAKEMLALPRPSR